MRRVLVLLFATGCIQDSLVPCGDLACPAGSVCSAVGCATPDQLSVCLGMVDGTACMTVAITGGVCTSGVCLPVICGDKKVIGPEVCDDGNQRSGDGCSADCLSTETCGNGYVDGVAGEQCDDGFLGLSRDGCTSTCEAELDSWFEISPKIPGIRYSPGLAFDAARGEVVLFGGGNSLSVLGDTWTWKDGAWHHREAAHVPAARISPVMTYDAARKVVVMAGGYDGGQLAFADTWQWDGIDWTELTPSVSPPDRSDATAAYYPPTQQMVVFGGVDSGGLRHNDTWLWNGTTWSEAASAMTPPAEAGYMAYDAPSSAIVMFVPSTAATWTWTPAGWVPRSPSAAPSVRQAPSVGPTPTGVVLYGGFIQNSGWQTDTWRWTGGTWQPEAASPNAGARGGTVLVYDSIRNKLVMPVSSTDVWEWSGVWGSQVPTVTPGTRLHYTGAYEPWSGRILLFGGNFLIPTWELDGGAWVLRAPAQHPPYQITHGMAATRDRVVMVGDDGTTYLWDGTNWSFPTPAHSPGMRTNPALAYDEARDRVVMFGGNTVGDTLEWDGTDWQQPLPTSAPSARSAAGIAYDAVRKHIVLYGGSDATTTFGDTWEWDGSDWHQIAPAHTPGARRSASMAYDAGRRRIVLYGGFSPTNGTYDDLWEWDGVDWQRLDPVFIPAGRGDTLLAYDRRRAGLVLFGGSTEPEGNQFGDTWIHQFTSRAHPADRCIDADTDGDGLVGCNDPDCWGRCTPLCPPGTSCDPSSPHCGDGVCSPLEDYRLCPQDCPP